MLSRTASQLHCCAPQTRFSMHVDVVEGGLSVSTVFGTSDLSDPPVVILTYDREIDDAASKAGILRPCSCNCAEV